MAAATGDWHPCRIEGCGHITPVKPDKQGRMEKLDRILVASHLMMCHAFSWAEANREAGLRVVE